MFKRICLPTSILVFFASVASLSFFTYINIDFNTNFDAPLAYAVSELDNKSASDRFNKSAAFLEKYGLDEMSNCAFIENPLCDTSLFHTKLKNASLILADPSVSSVDATRVRESFVTTTSEGAEKLAYPKRIALAALTGNAFLAWFASALLILAAAYCLVCVVVLLTFVPVSLGWV